MRKALVVIAVSSLMASIAFAVPTRVDYNGELVSDNNTNGATTGDTPYGWSWYTDGAGGGLGARYHTGSSSNAYVVRNEDEDALSIPKVYPGGHGVIFGGAGGVGEHGIQQTINSVAGKHYFFVVSQKQAGYNSNASMKWGLSQGENNHSGGLMNNASNSTSTLGKNNYMHGMIATGDKITAHVGVSSTGANGINYFADGVRVWQQDVIVHTSLFNGDFDAPGTVFTNITNYGAKNGDTNVRDSFLPEGWLPMGGGAGGVNVIKPVLDATGWGNALSIDGYNTPGRTYWMQRINDGLPAHTWTFDGQAMTWNTSAADARIGIDPTGGTDPNSPNIVWSDAAGSVQPAWNDLSVTTMGQGTNGITVWFASGWDMARGASPGSSTSTLTNWDNFTLVPEPATMLLLALGGLVCLRRR